MFSFFFNAFFKGENNAVRIANYYECLIVASDIETKKKIIKGFDYLNFGAINLYNGDKSLGCIEMKRNKFIKVDFNELKKVNLKELKNKDTTKEIFSCTICENYIRVLYCAGVSKVFCAYCGVDI